MHGTRGSRAGIRRYICSTHRYSSDCDQPIAKAEPLEAQLVEWMSEFQPDPQLRAHVLAAQRAEAQNTEATMPSADASCTASSTDSATSMCSAT
jgi:hypothetical protein